MSFDQLKSYTDEAGLIYGTEDSSVFLYSMVKMLKPQRVLELGTGMGVVTCWVTKAMNENGIGVIRTFDNESNWADVQKYHPFYEDISYLDHIDRLIQTFRIHHVEFYVRDVDYSSDGTIDFLICNFNTSPDIVEKVFTSYLPLMTENSTIIYYNLPNNSQSKDRAIAALELSGRKYQVLDMIENKDRHHNNFSVIRLLTQ